MIANTETNILITLFHNANILGTILHLVTLLLSSFDMPRLSNFTIRNILTVIKRLKILPNHDSFDNLLGKLN